MWFSKCDQLRSHVPRDRASDHLPTAQVYDDRGVEPALVGREASHNRKNNPRPDQRDDTGLPDPAELCDRRRFPTVHCIEEHLLRSFIPAVYRPDRAGAHLPFTAQQAERTLVFLADHLQRTATENPDIAWWQLPEALPRRLPVLARWATTALATALRVTLPAGLTAALAYSLLRAMQDNTWTQTPRALVAGTVGAITAAAACALTATAKLATRNPRDPRGWTSGLVPLQLVRWHWDTRAIALALTCATVLATSTVLLLTGTIGATLGVTALIWGGMRTDNADPSTASTPRALLRNEQSIVLRNGLILATLGALTTAILYAWRVRTDVTYGAALLTGTTAGSIVGLFAGLFGRLSELASWAFTTTRHYLAAHYHLPRDLMAFLVDAHEQRGVLRQIGGVYQFRHPDLRHTLTTTREKTTLPTPNSPPRGTDTG